VRPTEPCAARGPGGPSRAKRPHYLFVVAEELRAGPLTALGKSPSLTGGCQRRWLPDAWRHAGTDRLVFGDCGGRI
jgi:hypothetical protein